MISLIVFWLSSKTIRKRWLTFCALVTLRIALIYQAWHYLTYDIRCNGTVFAAVNCCGKSPELTRNTTKSGARPLWASAFQLGGILTSLATSRIDHEIHEPRQLGPSIPPQSLLFSPVSLALVLRTDIYRLWQFSRRKRAEVKKIIILYSRLREIKL